MGDVTRRTVLGAAAWTVPVLSLAVASPAAAASGEPEPDEITLEWSPNPVGFSTTAWLTLTIPPALARFGPTVQLSVSEDPAKFLVTAVPPGWQQLGVGWGQRAQEAFMGSGVMSGVHQFGLQVTGITLRGQTFPATAVATAMTGGAGSATLAVVS